MNYFSFTDRKEREAVPVSISYNMSNFSLSLHAIFHLFDSTLESVQASESKFDQKMNIVTVSVVMSVFYFRKEDK